MSTNLIHRAVRAYTFNSPLEKGKYRLSELALRLSPFLDPQITVKTNDGRTIALKTDNPSYRFIYFTGIYEPAVTKIFTQIVSRGDVCLDIGANIGWFTTLFQKLTGESGHVHAFEPVPSIFEHLRRNVTMNEPPRNVTLNNIALGDVEKEIEMHVFRDLPDGHASMATFGEENYETFGCPMITLDSYLTQNKVGDVRVVKMDIEGAELMMLKGASKLFDQKELPVLEVEMALATTRGFGYLPNDLVEFISSHGDYEFYEIDERQFKLRRIHGFQAEDAGANVLCLPAAFNKQPLANWFA